MTWAGKRTVVVGARGRVGSRVCEQLRSAGATVSTVQRGDPLRLPADVQTVISCATLCPDQRIALGAAAAHRRAHLVDACGLPPAATTVHQFQKEQLRLTVGAGVLPGISELLPAWLTPPGAQSVRIAGYTYTWEPITRGAAEEMVQTPGRAETWTHGAVHAAAPRQVPSLPGVDGPHLGMPYLTPMLKGYANRTQPDTLAWYLCQPLDSPVAALISIGDPTRLVEATAHIDTASGTGGQLIACEVNGLLDGRPFVAAGLIGGASTYTLTAGAACWFAAATTADQHTGPASRPWAADQVDVSDLASVARDCGATVAERWSGSLTQTEEGTL